MGRQQGYVLLVIMLFATMLVIGAYAGARVYVGRLKRDQEVEMVHRGAQYTRAIKAYFRKFRRYPANLEQLENTNQIRFLRRRYKDPITGEDFKLLHLGEVQLQPRGATGAANPGVSAANMAAGSPLNQGSTSPLTTAGGAPVAGGSVGGAPIVGVQSASKKTSILEFNGKNHYNEWQFVYDPSFDRGGLMRGPYNGQSQPTLQPGQSNIPGQPGGATNPPPSQRLPNSISNPPSPR
jgi:uncharacterized membrane protein